MAAFIKTLMDKAKANIIYPRTTATAVLRSDGTTTVETALELLAYKPAICKKTYGSGQNVLTGTDTVAELPTVVLNRGMTSGTNNITIQKTAVYLVIIKSTWGMNATGFRYVCLRVNGVDRPLEATTASTPTNATRSGNSGIFQFTAGTVLDLLLRQDSGSTKDCYPELEVFEITTM